MSAQAKTSACPAICDPRLRIAWQKFRSRCKNVAIARKGRFTLIRQRVCLESVALRHFAGDENDHPSTSMGALRRLEAGLA